MTLDLDWEFTKFMFLPNVPVTGRFGHDPFRPEKTWTFRPKAWTMRPKKMDVSAKKMDISAKYIFNSFTESDIIISRGNH